ncbi:ATP-dependent RNA helicase dbp7 [Coemansia brasiliensis]|uniref:ATP-dependent RNA helicase n=1 Tax=Coemansia brasiliensis TaxID=2650707 RepID=A0A9W8I6R2_9FUNG|nr:ATP-dependent RNA helicase dbp7 [Coemansia brasiliensis]
MEDNDGLVLNLAPASEQPSRLVITKPLPKGGRWKERMEQRRKIRAEMSRARLQARKAKGEKEQKDRSAKGVSKEQQEQQEQVDQVLAEISASSKGKKVNISQELSKTSLSQQAGKQIVSSLFTRNPDIPTLARTTDSENRVTSNAVLDTSSFKGIGIHADMVEYLESRMEISKPTAIQQNAIPVLTNKSVQDALAVDDGNDAFDIEQTISIEHDVFIQAATGSGKTLSYLLPIFHRLIQATAQASSGPPPSRSLGTFAIVLTPTRELAQQVLETAQQLSKSAGKLSNWIVPGIVIGGDKKQSEKGRLRKGVTVLACTPGRLLDHLENTQSFFVDHLRWLVLDEADRLLELGFEETLSKILLLLDEKAKRRTRVLGHRSVATSLELPKRRINILCSATLRDNVRRLANESLHDPKFINATRVYDSADQAVAASEDGGYTRDPEESDTDDNEEQENMDDQMDVDGKDNQFSLPSQLEQKAVVIPAKLRLVTLVAQLRNTFRKNPASKVIVFLLCKDSVDFMFYLLSHGGLAPELDDGQAQAADLFQELENSDGLDKKAYDMQKQGSDKAAGPTLNDEDISLESSVVSGVDLYRLHGSMPQKRRTETFLAFSKARRASVLFTTDVASRGLDLPNVSSIIQFDPPSDIESYLHRVGRTARLGRAGEAVLFLLPSESKYLDLLEEKGLRPDDESMESVLKLMAKHEGARKGVEWQLRAGEVQAKLERFVISNSTGSRLAKQAYLSSIRAYATHITAERHIFHVKYLHFGHLAKSFALRETPNQVAQGKGNNSKAEDVKKENKEKREKELALKKKPTFKRGNDISEFAVGDISAYYGPRVKRTKDD